jgi:hypothetical protein
MALEEKKIAAGNYPSDDQPTTLPKFYTPEEIGKHFGWSPRRIRSIVREHGLCSIVGNRLIMTDAHLEALLEITKPRTQESVRNSYKPRIKKVRLTKR